MEPSKHQKFVMGRVLRSEILHHPKNPRIISDEAKKKLRGKMQEVGLLQPLIINKITGYLLGGHQRLATLDSLERYKEGKNDYLLDVAFVELSEKEELEMLVFLNNPSSMGKWDTSVLAELSNDIAFDDMGFDRVDIELLFDGNAEFSSMFVDIAQVRESKDALQSSKEDRKQMTESKQKEQSVDYYVTVVCNNQEEKEKLMKHLGIPKGELYISPHEIFALSKK